MKETELPAPATDRLFYDGGCGLCHGAVRFVLGRDRRSGRFRFAPLSGPTFERLVPARARGELPDSLVVLTRDGRLLDRSAAVVYILRQLEGVWPLIGNLVQVLPAGLRDAAYEWVARHRFRLFRAPGDACPVADRVDRRLFDP